MVSDIKGNEAGQGCQTIRVTTCLVLPGLSDGSVLLGPDISTIGDLLNYFGRRIGLDLTEGGTGLMKDLDVLINGRDLCFHPDGLASRLSGEDNVQIYFRPLGGG